MAIAFAHFFVNLIIGLIILRLLQAKAAEKLGPASPWTRALAFID